MSLTRQQERVMHFLEDPPRAVPFRDLCAGLEAYTPAQQSGLVRVVAFLIDQDLVSAWNYAPGLCLQQSASARYQNTLLASTRSPFVGALHVRLDTETGNSLAVLCRDICFWAAYLFYRTARLRPDTKLLLRRVLALSTSGYMRTWAAALMTQPGPTREVLRTRRTPPRWRSMLYLPRWEAYGVGIDTTTLSIGYRPEGAETKDLLFPHEDPAGILRACREVLWSGSLKRRT